MNSKSINCNSLYAIHYSLYSVLISLLIINSFLLFYLILNCSITSIKLIILLIHFNSLFIIIYNWITDYWIESIILFSINEQLNIINAIKLLLISELMLFYSCFWVLINSRLIVNSISLISIYPLLSSYAFSIPFSNLLLLLFSSYPLNGVLISIKNGNLLISITLLTSSLSFGFIFLILQLKEFLFSYISISDSISGSIFYFTTSLHGLHVLIGSLSLFILFINLLFTINYISIEYSITLFLVSLYWHFVDFIWFIVFLLLIIYYSLLARSANISTYSLIHIN